MPSASNPGPRLALDAGTRREIQDMQSAQRDLFAGAAGLVDGRHNLQRLQALFASYQRLAAGSDGLTEIAKLPLKRLERNGHRVGRAGSYVSRNRRGFARIIFDIPCGELISGNDSCPFCSVKLGTLGVSRPESSGGLDHASCSVGIAHYRV